MKEFLAPLWEWLFDTFGMFGLLLAATVPMSLIVIVLLLVMLVRALVSGKKKKTTYRVGPVSPPAAQPVYRPESKPEPVSEPESLSSSQTPEELYQKGNDTQDVALSLRYYEMAAEKGHIIAQFMTGIMYYNGSGCGKPQKKTGLVWLEKAANSGHLESIYRLGLHYFETGKEENMAQAKRWLDIAAENDHEDAQFCLYTFYNRKYEQRKAEISSSGIRWQDDPQCLEFYRTSKHWLKEAAKNGHSEAQYLAF